MSGHLDALEDASQGAVLQLLIRQAVGDLLRRAAVRALAGAESREGHGRVGQHVVGIRGPSEADNGLPGAVVPVDPDLCAGRLPTQRLALSAPLAGNVQSCLGERGLCRHVIMYLGNWGTPDVL